MEDVHGIPIMAVVSMVYVSFMSNIIAKIITKALSKLCFAPGIARYKP